MNIESTITEIANTIKDLKISICTETPMQSIGKLFLCTNVKEQPLVWNSYPSFDIPVKGLDLQKKIEAYANCFIDYILDSETEHNFFVFVSESYGKFRRLNLPESDMESFFGMCPQDEYNEDCSSNTFRCLSFNTLNLLDGKQFGLMLPYKYNDKGIAFFENVNEDLPDLSEVREISLPNYNVVTDDVVAVALHICYEEYKKPGTHWRLLE